MIFKKISIIQFVFKVYGYKLALHQASQWFSQPSGCNTDELECKASDLNLCNPFLRATTVLRLASLPNRDHGGHGVEKANLARIRKPRTRLHKHKHFVSPFD